MSAVKKIMPKGREWQPGQSGNPKGRPPGGGLKGYLERALEGNVVRGQVMPDGKTVAQVIAENLIIGAVDVHHKYHAFCLKEIVTRFAPIITQTELTVAQTDDTEKVQRRTYSPDEIRQIISVYTEGVNDTDRTVENN